MTDTVKDISTVKVEYTGKLEDGTVFDKTQDKPLEFEMGKKMLLPAFEEAVKGMKLNESKTFKLTPENGYGERVEDLVKEVPKEALPKEPEVKKGMMLAIQAPDGRKIPAVITEVGDKTVKLDLNHPLAGKALNFEIKVVDIK